MRSKKGSFTYFYTFCNVITIHVVSLTAFGYNLKLEL